MKPELTLELKKRFYAQYYGQKVMADKQMPDKLFLVDPLDAERERSYLKIRPLSNITDDEAANLSGLWRSSDGSWQQEVQHGKAIAEDFNSYSHWVPAVIGCTDYLRSIGIAIPFMGYSVEELVSVGWVRLVES